MFRYAALDAALLLPLHARLLLEMESMTYLSVAPHVLATSRAARAVRASCAPRCGARGRPQHSHPEQSALRTEDKAETTTDGKKLGIIAAATSPTLPSSMCTDEECCTPPGPEREIFE